MQTAYRKSQIANWRQRTPRRSPCLLLPVHRPPSTVSQFPSTRRRRGFTLLELMLVLALLAAVAAMAWPALEKPLATQRLRRAAEQVRMHLLKARTKAIVDGETFAFRYQLGQANLRIDKVSQNDALIEVSSVLGATGSQFGGQVGGSMPTARPSTYGGATTASVASPPVEDVLPEPIVFYGGQAAGDTRSQHLAAKERSQGATNLDWSQPILFHPDGTAMAAQVVVADDRGRAIVIAVRSLTGAARVGGIISVEELRQ